MARGYNYAEGASPEVNDARKPFLHRATIAMHGQSKNAVVREIIAGRDDLPFGLTVTLAHDRVAEVRCAIAANPVTGGAILEHLAADRDKDVLVALVGNRSLPTELLEKLLFNKREEVRLAAAERLDGRGLELVPAAEDSATPELRDVAVGGPVPQAWSAELRRAAPPLSAVPALAAAPSPARPVRTAPVRGYLPPPDADVELRAASKPY